MFLKLLLLVIYPPTYAKITNSLISLKSEGGDWTWGSRLQVYRK